MDNSQKIKNLEIEIAEKQKLGQDVTYLVEKEIDLFLEARKYMIEEIKKRNIDYNLTIAQAEIAQLKAVVRLCQKINRPIEKYENRINKIQQYFVGDNVSFEISTNL